MSPLFGQVAGGIGRQAARPASASIIALIIARGLAGHMGRPSRFA